MKTVKCGRMTGRFPACVCNTCNGKSIKVPKPSKPRLTPVMAVCIKCAGVSVVNKVGLCKRCAKAKRQALWRKNNPEKCRIMEERHNERRRAKRAALQATKPVKQVKALRPAKPTKPVKQLKTSKPLPKSKALQEKNIRDMTVAERSKVSYDERIVQVIKSRSLEQVLNELKRNGGYK